MCRTTLGSAVGVLTNLDAHRSMDLPATSGQQGSVRMLLSFQRPPRLLGGRGFLAPALLKPRVRAGSG
jgi:hypothetical protein